MTPTQSKDQWVCRQCGFNMIGKRPSVCPFCGGRQDHFIAWDEAEKTYRIKTLPVTEGASQLLCVPKLARSG